MPDIELNAGECTYGYTICLKVRFVCMYISFRLGCMLAGILEAVHSRLPEIKEPSGGNSEDKEMVNRLADFLEGFLSTSLAFS